MDTLKVSPSGGRIAISMNVLPDCDDLQCTKNKLAARKKSKAMGQGFDRLFVRHWSNGTHSNLFAARIYADGKVDTPVDLSKSLV